MSWIFLAILAYFLFALADIADKFFLVKYGHPREYAFYVGLLGVLAVILIPFVGFVVPEPWLIGVALVGGAAFVFGLFGLFISIERFDVSSMVPSIGTLVPIFSLLLVWVFYDELKFFSPLHLVSFAFLLAGGLLVALESKSKISLELIRIVAVPAVLFSLFFVLAKQVYDALNFWQAFLWLALGGVTASLLLLLSSKTRKEVFSAHPPLSKNEFLVFLAARAFGAGGFILQNKAIAQALTSQIPFINALQGTHYAFLFALAIIFSSAGLIPKEGVSKTDFYKKLLAIFLIAAGLTLLALF